ncbi:putative structural protein [Bacillus phage vB_BceM_Bc431v3]|uniref:Putative structural protein n=1 Tax=Bacillus phage vB_BceM_Bc431v3 TaxID=1195072 RepID=M4HQ27_9CAUD|nr:putative structural protein [Bacillus phage vB_BceM_Bc431v3]AFQ96475.1 putative structural protein [Bacillus phage vB_BceM_Bc431v3]
MEEVKMTKEMVKVEHDLLTERVTKVYREKESSFHAPHLFTVTSAEDDKTLAVIHFQEGALNVAGVNGVMNEDLLVMILTRLQGFQNSEFACKENEMAITKIEEALLWLRKRTMGREKRGVLGTHTK